MTSGERGSRGFSYIAVLLTVAVIGIGLAATGVVWSQARQREKEQELLFVGEQFREAIRLYYERTPGPVRLYPRTLEALLADPRYPSPQRYLRKLYPDPVTGKPEWGLIAAPDGGIMGVHSLSGATPIKRAEFSARNRPFDRATTYAEWQFFYEPASSTSPVAQATGGSGAAAVPAVPGFAAPPAPSGARPR